jgi:hypothetical protein
MAYWTDRDLLPIELSEDAVESGWFPFLRQFANMSDMVHLDLSGFACFSTDAARFTQPGACSHVDRHLELVTIRLASWLERLTVFAPVVVQEEANLPVRFPFASFDDDA